MSIQANKATVARYGELWTTGNLAIADEICADDLVILHADGGETSGRAAFKAGVALHHDRLADFRVSIDDVVADGDKVAIRFTARANHTGPFLGSTPSGQPLRWTGMQLLYLTEGRIARIRHQPDDLNLMRQLGLIPPAAPAGG